MWEDFYKEYISRGFGNMPKREIDVMIFHLMEKNGVFNGKSNFQIARILRTTPTKVKSLKYESVLRFMNEDIQSSEFLKKRLANYFSNKPPLEFDDSYLKLQIEDPVLLDSLKALCKDEGVLTDGSFNKEILKVNQKDFSNLLEKIAFEGSKEKLAEFKKKHNTPFKDVVKHIWKSAKDVGSKEGLKALASNTYCLIQDSSEQITEIIKTMGA